MTACPLTSSRYCLLSITVGPHMCFPLRCLIMLPVNMLSPYDRPSFCGDVFHVFIIRNVLTWDVLHPLPRLSVTCLGLETWATPRLCVLWRKTWTIHSSWLNWLKAERPESFVTNARKQNYKKCFTVQILIDWTVSMISDFLLNSGKDTYYFPFQPFHCFTRPCVSSSVLSHSSQRLTRLRAINEMHAI